MPPHRLNLKVGAIVMLLRNLLISQGLCKGARMKMQSLHEHCVEALLVTGSNRGRTFLIIRIKLSQSDANIPFTLNRLQFPLPLAYSMTIRLKGKHLKSNRIFSWPIICRIFKSTNYEQYQSKSYDTQLG
uniref:DNA helicase Pif1-like 2B domain-containing protein n=1 Tax=Octopus bimaculoides TaxID=37653 RepID=A0A0L8I365_OCTBM